MKILFRKVILATCLIPMASAAPEPEPVAPELEEALQKLVIRVSTTEATHLERLLATRMKDATSRTSLLQTLKDWQRLFRTPSDQPMSEMSAPLALVRSVKADGSDKANACVFVLRVGPMGAVRLATYEMEAMRAAANQWAISSIIKEGRCLAEPDPFLMTPSVPQLPDGAPEQIQPTKMVGR